MKKKPGPTIICTLRALNSINSTPVLSLFLQGDRRFKAVRGANRAVSPRNCTDRVSPEFRWQVGAP